MTCPTCKGVAFTETYQSTKDGGTTWSLKTILRCASRRLKRPCKPVVAYLPTEERAS